MTTDDQLRRHNATAEFLDSLVLDAVAAKSHGAIVRLADAISDFQNGDDYDTDFDAEIRRLRAILVRIRNLLFAAATPE